MGDLFHNRLVTASTTSRSCSCCALTADTHVGTTELNINGVAHSQAAGGQLLPQPVGTAAAQREGSASRHPASLPFGRLRTGVEGVSTRRVDDLIKALGCDGISSSQVSPSCQQLDEVVSARGGLGRPLDGRPYCPASTTSDDSCCCTLQAKLRSTRCSCHRAYIAPPIAVRPDHPGRR